MSPDVPDSRLARPSDNALDVLRRRLHDTTLQTLEYIANAGTMGGQTDFERLARLAAREATELRYLLEGVVSESPKDLADTLRSVVRDAQAYADHRIELALGPHDASLQHLAVVELGGAVREALTNVRKHARASRVTVYAEESAGSAIITVADDGQGADLERLPAGLGLMHSITGRCERLGGRADVQSTAGEGFRVTMRFGRFLGTPASDGPNEDETRGRQ
jgi:signal transduction histidine kinase